jgi:DNA polymerase-3 subunit beta
MRCLGHAANVTERKHTIPILANALLEAEDGLLRITGTDLELAITDQIEATIDKPGRATMPARLVHDMISKLPEKAMVYLETDAANDRIVITAGRFNTSVVSLPVEDFPAMSGGASGVTFKLPGATLRKIIDRTRCAIATDETRYYLNGFYLHTAGARDSRTLRAVATDGHRLALIDVPLPERLEGVEFPGVIVPRKTALELRRLLDDNVVDVTLTISETRFTMATESATLRSKLVDGTFPQYEAVIPAPGESIITLDRTELVATLSRVAAVASERSRAISLENRDGSVEVACHAADAGSASEFLDPSKAEVSGCRDGFRIGFQARYVQEAAEQFAGKMRLHVGDGNMAVRIDDTEQPEYLHVLMPMRV